VLFFNSLNPNALAEDSKGCKEKRLHKEDVKYTLSLQHFAFKAPEETITETIEVADFKKLETISFSELENNPNFFVHSVSVTDTLVGIGMKYDIPAGIIQRVNRLPTQQIFERRILYIPKTKDNIQFNIYPADEFKLDREKIKSKFISATKCSKEGAVYYLEDAEYNYDEAISLFKEDMNWNKKQQLKNGPSFTSNTSQPPKKRSC